MQRSRLLSISILLALACGYAPSGQAEFNIALEHRNVYTRWYEYPGRYWEEDFSVNGIRAEYAHAVYESSPIAITIGVSAGFYSGSYVNSPGQSFDATAVRPAVMTQLAFQLQNSLSLFARAEIPYWLGFGVGDNSYHSSDFTVYFPSIDIAAGAMYVLGKGAIKSIALAYGVTLVDLGVATDMYFRNTPVSENWGASALTLTVGF